MADTWTALLDILDLPPTTAPDDVLSLIRRLAADRTPDQQQLLWDAVPEGISRAELERRMTLALHHMHGMCCPHAATAFLILRDGVRPAERTRCAPREVTGG